MTVNPYLGTDGVMPFVKIAAREHKGVFVLVRTSNASAGEFQDLVSQGPPLYRHVAEEGHGLGRRATRGHRATASSERSSARRIPRNSPSCAPPCPGSSCSCPGYGTQGGSSRDVASAFDENGLGALDQ